MSTYAARASSPARSRCIAGAPVAASWVSQLAARSSSENVSSALVRFGVIPLGSLPARNSHAAAARPAAPSHRCGSVRVLSAHLGGQALQAGDVVEAVRADGGDVEDGDADRPEG